MSTLFQSEARIFHGTGGGGGLSGSVIYSDPIDCRNAEALLVDFVFVKAGVNLIIGVVDERDDSKNATIAARKFPRASSLSSAPGTLAETHTITSTTTGTLAVNLGGLGGGKVRISMQLSGGGAAGDVLDFSAVISERS